MPTCPPASGPNRAQFQPAEELFQRFAGADIKTLQFVQVAGGDVLLPAERQKLLQRLPGRLMNAQFQIAESAPADAAAALQACQAEHFAQDGDAERDNGAAERRVDRPLAQMRLRRA